MSSEPQLSPSPLHVRMQNTRLQPAQNTSLNVTRPPPPDALDVVLKSTQIIVPSEPTPDTVIYLSNIDRGLVYIVETVHFYAGVAHKSSENVAEVLRDCLSRFLSGPYHFLAGRLESSPGGRLQIACNRRGVYFAEASACCSIKELGDITDSKPEFRKLVLQAFTDKRIEDLPLFHMQVTRFRCGGFAIGLGTSHAVMDGVGSAQFILNYASFVRGEGLVSEPYTDRDCLRARSPLRIEYEHDEFIKLRDLPPEVQASLTILSLGSDSKGASGHIRPAETHVFRSFLFSKQDFDDLKRRAMEDGALTRCSSFEVLTAHLWKIRAKASELKPEQTSTVFYAVDIRNRMKPPLHPNFCGNGIFPAFARATAGELSKMSLSSCVERIREAKAAVTDKYVRSLLDWSEAYSGIPAIVDGCFFVSVWWNLRFDDADFGWGKPLYFGPVVNRKIEFLLLLSGPSKDSCRVYLALEPPHMAQFESLLYPSLATDL